MFPDVHPGVRAGGKGSTVHHSDKIFAMEAEQADYIEALVPGARGKTIVLDIPDIYRRNHPRLRALLEERVTPYLP